MTTARTHARLLRELESLTPKLLFGSISTTFKTCGQARCACHSDPERRHGPYVHVGYRRGGRTESYNVPAAQQAQVREGVEAWRRLQEIAHELAERNRSALGLGPGRRRTR
jgi:hypothetical protein